MHQAGGHPASDAQELDFAPIVLNDRQRFIIVATGDTICKMGNPIITNGKAGKNFKLTLMTDEVTPEVTPEVPPEV